MLQRLSREKQQINGALTLSQWTYTYEGGREADLITAWQRWKRANQCGEGMRHDWQVRLH